MINQDFVVTKPDRIWEGRFNRPHVLNALRRETLLGLGTALNDLANAPPATSMIITGEGKAFCAGGDIGEMELMTEADARSFAWLAQKTVKTMETVEKPLIAAVNGPALGAGFDLALSCDLVVASEDAVFGLPTLRLGVITPFGGNSRLPRMIGLMRAKHLIFTGETLDAKSALALGLVNEVVEKASLLGAARSLAEKVLEKAPIALGFSKRLANLGFSSEAIDLNALEMDLYAKCFGTSDRREGARAFLEKRKPVFTGH